MLTAPPIKNNFMTSSSFSLTASSLATRPSQVANLLRRVSTSRRGRPFERTAVVIHEGFHVTQFGIVLPLQPGQAPHGLGGTAFGYRGCAYGCEYQPRREKTSWFFIGRNSFHDPRRLLNLLDAFSLRDTLREPFSAEHFWFTTAARSRNQVEGCRRRRSILRRTRSRFVLCSHLPAHEPQQVGRVGHHSVEAVARQ